MSFPCWHFPISHALGCTQQASSLGKRYSEIPLRAGAPRAAFLCSESGTDAEQMPAREPDEGICLRRWNNSLRHFSRAKLKGKQSLNLNELFFSPPIRERIKDCWLPTDEQFYSVLFLYLVCLFLPSLHPPGTGQINKCRERRKAKHYGVRLQPRWEPCALSQHIRCVFLLTAVVRILNQKPGFSPPTTTLYSLNVAKQ